jgi:hypothetical protein
LAAVGAVVLDLVVVLVPVRVVVVVPVCATAIAVEPRIRAAAETTCFTCIEASSD